jgi:GNAT superfamily N-acetyltransferase
LRIEKLQKAELEAFVMSEAFTQMRHIPISRHRAISQVRSPRAKEEDVLLLIAYEEDKMLGYLGLLPDDFHTGDKIYHFAWMSTIWVHPEARGKGVARSLLDTAMEVYGGQVIGTDFTAEAKAIYLKTGHFDLFQKYEGIRLYYRFNLRDLLPPKKRFFKRIRPVLAAADAILNFFNNLSPKPSVKIDAGIKEFEEWTEEHEKFLQQLRDKSPTLRGIPELNWIIKNPWVLESSSADELGRRYHFTSAEKRAHFQSVEIRKNGQPFALLLLFIRGNAMKVPYAFFGAGEETSVCACIDELMREKRLSILTMFHPVLRQALHGAKTRAFHKQTIVREYVIGIPFHQKIEKEFPGHFQDGDGDCAFV